jgi:hypothetical protein
MAYGNKRLNNMSWYIDALRETSRQGKTGRNKKGKNKNVHHLMLVLLAWL